MDIQNEINDGGVILYTYDELKNDILIGHEVEFYYCGQKYSISKNQDGWYLSKFGEVEYQKFEDQHDLLKNALINSLLLSEIWKDVRIDTIF